VVQCVKHRAFIAALFVFVGGCTHNNESQIQTDSLVLEGNSQLTKVRTIEADINKIGFYFESTDLFQLRVDRLNRTELKSLIDKLKVYIAATSRVVEIANDSKVALSDKSVIAAKLKVAEDLLVRANTAYANYFETSGARTSSR